MSIAGHFWSVAPTVRDLVLPGPALPAGAAVDVPIVDATFGPGRLSATLRTPPSARDVVVVVHGLGGSGRSGYVLRAARALHALGLATLCVDLRGADRSGSGIYHVALVEDLHAFLRTPALAAFERVFVLGFSMGGHVALHLAAAPEDGRLRGVAALGTPLDLHGVQRHLDRPAGAFYRHWVLHGLKGIYAAVAARTTVPTPWPVVRRCRTFHEWDTHVICRRYGEATPESFYARHSAARILPHLAVDCVLVTAVADPLVPPALVLPHAAAAPPGRLRVCLLPRGGHVHYPSGQPLGLTEATGSASVVAQLAAHWARSR